MSTNDEKKATKAKYIIKSISKYPNLKQFLEILLNDIQVDTKRIGKSFEYPSNIIEHGLYPNYGIFMDYFIRKHLSNQFQINLKDESVELVLRQPDIYLTGNQRKNYNQILNHYNNFKDSETRAMDIIRSIKIISIAYTLTNHDFKTTTLVEGDPSLLLEVIKYFNGLPYKKVDIKTNVDCKYFNGNCGLIFNDKTLYEIKTSKYKSLSRQDAEISKVNFYKLILYGFGYYKKTGIIIKTFKIYNPLLGLEYEITLDDIDMKLFEDCLEKDVLKSY